MKRYILARQIKELKAYKHTSKDVRISKSFKMNKSFGRNTIMFHGKKTNGILSRCQKLKRLKQMQKN